MSRQGPLGGEEGQIIPPLLVVMLLCMAFGFMMLQVGVAADYKSRAQTAADAAALAGGVEVKREIIAAWAMDHQLQPAEINMPLVCAQAAIYAARNRATMTDCQHEPNDYDIKVQVVGNNELETIGDTEELDHSHAKAKARATPWGFGGFGGGGLPIGGGGGGALMGAKPGLQVYADAAAKFGLHVVSGLRPGAITNSGNVSWHASGNALDLAAPMTPAGKLAMLKFAQYAAETWGSQLEELIHTPLGYGVKNGARVAPYAAADHYDHVHIADTDPPGPGDESGPPTNGGAGAGPSPGGGGGGFGGFGALTVHLVRWDGQGGRFPDIGVPDGVPASVRQVLFNIMMCESHGDPRAIEPPGGRGGPLGHYGLFQFDLPTWQSVGGHGNPMDASPEEQWTRAVMLYQRRGVQPWECATADNLLNYA